MYRRETAPISIQDTRQTLHHVYDLYTDRYIKSHLKEEKP